MDLAVAVAPAPGRNNLQRASGVQRQRGQGTGPPQREAPHRASPSGTVWMSSQVLCLVYLWGRGLVLLYYMARLGWIPSHGVFDATSDKVTFRARGGPNVSGERILTRLPCQSYEAACNPARGTLKAGNDIRSRDQISSREDPRREPMRPKHGRFWRSAFGRWLRMRSNVSI